MKRTLKVITIQLSTLAILATGSSPSQASTLLQDSSQGRLFPIVICLSAVGTLPPINIHFNPLDGPPYGAWTSFFYNSFGIRTIESYITGDAAPPLLKAGDWIYTNNGVSLLLLDNVQQFINQNNPKVLLPVVFNSYGGPVACPGDPGYHSGDPFNVIGVVGFNIDGTNNSPYYIYGHFNDPPVISGIPPASATTEADYIFMPTASDADGDKLTFSISNKPPWARFDTITGLLSGMPGPGDVGTFNNIVISVSDGGFKAVLPTFSITVNPSPDNPSPVKMVASGQPDRYFHTPSEAISMLMPGVDSTIMCNAVDFTAIENLILDVCDTTITISGGYDQFFNVKTGITRIDGSIEIDCGTLIVDDLEIGNAAAP